MPNYTLEQSRFSHFFLASAKSAPFWFLVRLYVGYEWLIAGWEKVTNPAWFGSGAGAAMNGFIQGALRKTAEFCQPGAACHPDVQMWYAAFLKGAVLPHLVSWSNAIAVGEVLVGLGLLAGLFVGTAAFFGFFMNLNFLLAGTVSVNPTLMVLALALMSARRVAGHWGLDRYVRPYLKRKFYSQRF
ncbi:TPA: DoxX family protein [Candidatus Kaiserbacteria bacterium]|nr:MAG: DoxX family protein [Parcubacteria group bacterium GW2011_GWA1_56_13]KKW46929.1 MAG: DoxX family protein [Parcubacteria group bacterium GW2011_GWB1_57_6]HCR52602.1 DoxX family protein [Candidatus Kaiserbacteria bacterium]